MLFSRILLAVTGLVFFVHGLVCFIHPATTALLGFWALRLLPAKR
jgi:hypothetical protein